MIPIIPILAWTGGIAAGAQVAGGVVRGMAQLVRGNPGAAMLEVADGCLAPLKTACEEVSKLGHEVYQAVLEPWQSEPAPPEPATTKRQRCQRPHDTSATIDESVNGASIFATES